jgi:crotonobetainyl-CoA:carnitine CoA-transferase CaiB-like acyl-CoA transferase
MNFFKDLKVVELANVLAGPAVGMFFAELGAEVVKIENKRTDGDITRRWKLPSEDPKDPYSAYYCSANWGKKVLLRDLSQEQELLEVLQLIDEADIVISNFKDQSAIRLGLDYESLKKRNPRLIYGTLSGMGEENIPAFDVVLQAEAGFLYMTGQPGGPPAKMPVALIDLLAAHQLKEGILLALMQREKTGKGTLVQTSLLEAALASLANQATNWLMAGHVPGPMGTQHPNIAPYGDTFICRDKKAIVLAVGTERQFQNLLQVLNLDELREDERFSRNSERVRHRQELNEVLEEKIRTFTRPDLLEKFQQQGVPAGSIRHMKEVFELPTARAMILDEVLPNGKVSQRLRTVAFQLEDG